MNNSGVASPKERIDSLDYLRGVAILGMLFVNIPWHTGTSMSHIHSADFSSVAAWLLQYVVIDQRFMPIFGMLFGAGFLILSEGRARSPGFNAYVFRRMGVLLAIGVAHAYLIWPGDILINYALCGPILLLFYQMSAKRLLIYAVVFKTIHLSLFLFPAIYEQTFHRVLFAWWLEIGEAPMSESAAYAGSYADLFRYNAWRNQFIQWTAMLDYRIWNALAFMIAGMGLYKLNILSGSQPKIFYYRMLKISLALGSPLLVYGVLGRIGGDEAVSAFVGLYTSLPYSGLSYQLGTTITAISMLSGLLLLFTTRPDTHFIRLMRSVGRMALSNYIFQSLIFFVIFAMLELVPYDVLDPDERLLWAVAIWFIQIATSSWWMRNYSMGPLESIWRRFAGPGPARM